MRNDAGHLWCGRYLGMAKLVGRLLPIGEIEQFPYHDFQLGVITHQRFD